MKKLLILLLSLGLTTVSRVEAHAFLDHAEPRVGATVQGSPSIVKIWFTDDLNQKLSQIAVFDAQGREVDKKEVTFDAKDPSVMSVSVPALPSGTYQVVWHAVCPYGHHTQGTFTFTVKN